MSANMERKENTIHLGSPNDPSTKVGAAVPPKIGPYVLGERLGSGGMGAVYRAWDERLERSVALKQILPGAAANRRSRRRFRREARAAARLKHPSIVKIHDLVEAEGCEWIVMELVEGRALARFLSAGPLEYPVLLRVATEIADALAAAHGEGIVHRDLKALNVLLVDHPSPEGRRVKILDFGLAKDILHPSGDSTSLTGDGQLVGTPQAMSPEQAMGRRVDERSDLFSFGALLYEMTTGKPPFRAESPLSTIERVCRYHPPPLGEVAPGIPGAFAGLVAELLEKDPAHRPASAAEAAARLRRLAVTPGGPPPSARAPTTALQPDDETRGDRSVERRQVTVWCCELVESGGDLLTPEPEALHRAAPELARLVESVTRRFGGHRGEGPTHRHVVHFGYPKAQEDAAVRAVSAALELAERFANKGAEPGSPAPLTSSELAVRSSVHTATAVAGETYEPLALGQGLDAAYAVLHSAAPGEVWVSPATRQLLRDTFHVDTRPSTAGIPGVEQLFAVARPPDSGEPWSGAGQPAVLIGREAEMDLLLGRWREAAGGRGQVVMIHGEAGIGKTHLMQSFWRRLESKDAILLIAAGSSLGEPSPLQPIVELLRRRLGASALATPERLRNALQALGVRGDAPALLAELLGLPLPDGDLDQDPRRRRERTFETLVRFFLTSAERQPTLLLVEDLHWLDPSTLELLGRLVERMVSSRLLLVMTSRPRPAAPAWSPPGYQTELPLARLPNSDTAALIRRLLGDRQTSPQVVELILAKTDGVPLFVEELVKSLRETQLLIETDDGYQLADSIDAIELPATLRDSLTARLDRLGAAKSTMQLAATLGRELSERLLKAVSPLPPAELTAQLDRLIEAELIYPKGYSARRRFVFKHALIQEAAYESLLGAQRREHHGRIARILESRFAGAAESRPEHLARHWALASRPEKAIPCFRRAGEQSRAVYANAEARIFFERALRLIEPLDETAETSDTEIWRRIACDLNEHLGELATLERRFPEARKAFRTSLDDSEDAVEKARLERKIAGTLDLENREQEALEGLQLAESILGTPSPEDVAAWREWIEILLVRGVALYRANDLDALERLSAELEPVVERCGTKAHRVRAAETRLIAAMRRERYLFSASTRDRAGDYLAASERLAEKGQLAEAWCHLGMIQLFAEDYRRGEAARALTTGLDHARQLGDANIETQCLVYLAIALRRDAQVDEARRLSHHILAHKDARLEYIGVAHANLSWAAWREGRYAEAGEHGTSALDHWQAATMSYPMQWTAIFPLLAASLDAGRRGDPTTQARRLLEPSQARLPTLLEQAAQILLETATGPELVRRQRRLFELASRFDYL